jgi:hypothetical protein
LENEMADEKITRRQFVLTTATGALSVAAFGAFVSGCKSESGAADEDKKGEAPKEEPAGELDCTDVSALSDAEKKTRTSLQYVEKSTTPGQVCSGCQLYTPPPSGSGCGSCTVVKGPINPGGHCTSWVKKSA